LDEWRAKAACVGLWDLMYDDDREVEAIAVCRQCPVRAPCLAVALIRREPAGVWGGFAADERNALFKGGIPKTMSQVVSRISSRRRTS
jgi:WhiB family redox-sensing transcriptional regulator